MTVSVVKVHIGTLSDFPLQLGKTVDAGTLELAVFQTSNKQFKAIENRCPHKGGVLAEGMVSGNHVSVQCMIGRLIFRQETFKRQITDALKLLKH